MIKPMNVVITEERCCCRVNGGLLRTTGVGKEERFPASQSIDMESFINYGTFSVIQTTVFILG